ncbi:MAG: hypothetical protein ACOYNP_15470 [Gemmataceae bacterium]
MKITPELLVRERKIDDVGSAGSKVGGKFGFLVEAGGEAFDLVDHGSLGCRRASGNLFTGFDRRDDAHDFLASRRLRDIIDLVGASSDRPTERRGAAVGRLERDAAILDRLPSVGDFPRNRQGRTTPSDERRD